MIRIVRLFVVCVLLLTILPAALPTSAGQEPFTIGLSLPNLNSPFFEGLNNGAYNAAYEAGAEMVVVSAEDDLDIERANIDALVEQGVSAILFRPVDPLLSAPAVEVADEAGVPVILIGQLIIADDAEMHPASMITGSDTEGGEIAAATLCEAVNETGTVLELVSASESAAFVRNDSFEAAMAETCPDAALVALETAGLDDEALTEALVEAFRAQKFAGVFGYDGAVTVAALEASIVARSRGTIFVGFDATEQSIAAVQGGRLRAVITPYASELGEVGVQTSLALLNGEEIDDLIEVTMAVLDNSTIDAFRARCKNPRGCN